MGKRKPAKGKRQPAKGKPAGQSQQAAPRSAKRSKTGPGGGKQRRHPMPCPSCRKMIDATDHLCPYCGVDTDAMLAPARAALPFISIAVVVLIGAVIGRIPQAWAFGLIAGTVTLAIVTAVRRKRS